MKQQYYERKYYKPTGDQVIRVRTVKHGWRAWDNERGLYRLVQRDDADARPYWALTLDNGMLWESDARVWTDAGLTPQPDTSYRVRRDGNKTRVTLEQRPSGGAHDEALQLVKEIKTLLLLLESALGARGEA